MSFIEDARKLLKENIRDYGMYIALLVIVVFFAIATDGVFISPRNLVNLVNQTGYIAVLAIGMTLVIVIRHIDLSVGFLAGFLGAVAAIGLVEYELPVFVVIPIVLFIGILAGRLTSLMVANLGIPAFVATLAGWLGYRGALQLATRSTGTIVIPNDTFNAIGNDFIPELPGMVDSTFLPGLHKTTLILGLIAIIVFVVGEFAKRRRLRNQESEISSSGMFILKLVGGTVLIGGVSWILAGYRGLSWTAVVVIIVVIVYHFITTQTVLGRHIYAVGGNPEAAELSGISVKRITHVVFGSMGMLAALAGILFAARLQSATTTAGTLFELDAIAASFVGGVSAGGGIGTVIGSIIGAFVMSSLTNGMNLMGIDISYQYIVRAFVLAGAVIFDVTTRKSSD
ncbi:MAG: sugar ABC transporter permease [Candidatus Promineifilaceae bacterium]|jgi:putative multiple sugar transport system permease protein